MKRLSFNVIFLTTIAVFLSVPLALPGPFVGGSVLNVQRAQAAGRHLAITVQPSATVTAGNTFTVEVTIQNDDNSTDTSATETVNIGIDSSPDGANGDVFGTTTADPVNGVATFNDISLHGAEVGVTLGVTADNISSAITNAITVNPSTANYLSFSADPTPTVSTTFSSSVLVKDEFNNTVTSDTGRSITVAIASAGSSPGNGTLSGTLTRTTSGGTATFNNLAISAAGLNYTLSATASGLTSATTNNFNVFGTPAKVVITSSDLSTQTHGVTFTSSVSVAIQDANSLTITSNNSTQVAIAIGTNPASGTLSGTLTKTVSSGVASFDDLSINNGGLAYTLSVTSSGLTSATSAAFNVIGTPHQLQFSTVNSVSDYYGTFFVTVSVLDSNYLRVTNDNSTSITIALGSSGSSPGGGSLSGTLTRTVSSGQASFSGLDINSYGLGYTLTATASGLTSTTSNSFNMAGLATKLDFQQTLSSAAVNTAMSGFNIRTLDANDLSASSTGQSVTIAIGTNAGGGTLSGTLSQNTFSISTPSFTPTINAVGTGYTIIATASGLTSATSNTFNIYGPATKLGIATVSDATVNGTFTLTVSVQDSGSRTVESASNSITIALGSNPGSASLGGTLTRSASNGVATFSGLSLNQLADGYTITATASGLTGATSNSFNVVPASASQLAFTSQPSSTNTATAFSVTVATKDTYGNVATNDNSTSVTIAIGTNPASGTLSGTLTKTVSSGVATFNDLSISGTGTGYTLTATASGLTSTTSNAFNITAASGGNNNSGGGGGSSGGSGFNSAPPNTVPAVTLPPPGAPITPAVFSQALQAIHTAALAILQKILALMPATPLPPSPATPPASLTVQASTFTRDLPPGAYGDAVTRLQQFLVSKNAGPKALELKAHGLTKTFGPLTEAALAEFQKSVGLPATGFLGPKTRAYLAGQ